MKVLKKLTNKPSSCVEGPLLLDFELERECRIGFCHAD